MKIPPPPLPSGLSETLKDYPVLIYRLQEMLTSLVSEMIDRGSVTPDGAFERALWLLQDGISALRVEASEEVKIAEASGDPQAIERAKEKELWIGRSRHEIYGGGLKEYFEQYKEAFK
jgi:hypothetical protein